MVSTLVLRFLNNFILKRLDQGIFPQSKTFSRRRHFSIIRKCFRSRDFSLINELIQKQKFFHNQGRFPLSEIFRWSRKLSTSTKISMIKEVLRIFPRLRKFSTSKGFSIIKVVFYKQRILFDQVGFQ